MLPNHFEGLNSVSDAILTSLVHVHPRRNAFPALFHDPILEYERGDPFFLKPARDIVTFQIDGQGHESTARGDDDAGPNGLGSLRKVSRQRRIYHVEDHGSNRSIIRCPFLLGPILGTWGLRPAKYSRPASRQSKPSEM